MKIHEYQGKEIFRRFEMATPRGIPAFSVDEAVKAAETLGGPIWVVKAVGGSTNHWAGLSIRLKDYELKPRTTYGAVAALLGGTIMTIWLYAIGPGFSSPPVVPSAWM